MSWEKIIKKNCGCGKDPCETYGEVSKGEGQKHYTADGKEWKGKTHKMPNGSLMTENPHNEKSVKLYHKHELPKRRSAFTASD